MEWRMRFDSEEYRNWVSVGHAISLMCDGVRPYLQQAMKAFHGQLQVAVGPVTRCLCVPNPRRRPNPYHDLINCRWAAAIQNYYVGNPQKIAWHHSNSNMWVDPGAGPWEIAKLFMSDFGPDGHLVVDAQSTDPTGLINLMLWCGFLAVPKPLVDKVRKVRNQKWAHAPKQKLSNVETIEAFTCIKDLLKDPVFVAFPDAARYLHQIEDLEHLELFILQEAELQVLQELKNVMETERQEVSERMNSIQSTIDNVEKLLETDSERSQSKVFSGLLIFLLLLEMMLGAIRQRSKCLLPIFCVICCMQILGNGTLSEGCAFELSKTDDPLREFDFSGSLELAREHFTGRQWLFHEVEEAFEANKDDIKGVLILGAPGSGKSAFLAQLLCSRTSSIFIHKHTVAYHICSYSNRKTQNAAIFVRNIASLLSRRDKEYRNIIETKPQIRDDLVNLCPLKPSACFRKVVIEPLRQLEEAQIKTGSLRFILIDGLDECIPMETQGEIDILTLLREQLTNLPNSVKFIVTSRPMKRLSAISGHFTKREIKATDSKNINDIDAYITRIMYEKYSRFIFLTLRMLVGIDHRQSLANIMSKLISQSQGNFLFAREVLHFSMTATAEGHGLHSLPQTLSDVYQKYFERAFPTKQQFRFVQPILEILVASSFPVNFKDMFAILRGDDVDVEFEYDFDFKVNQLSHFLRYDSTKSTVALYHMALAEWLTSPENKGNLYYVFKQSGCRRLADYYLKVLLNNNTNLSSNTLIQVAQYISCSGMLENHIKLFRTFPSSEIINMKSNRGSLLHDAAVVRDSKISELLVYHFVDVDIVDENGFTPAFLSVIHGFFDNVRTFHAAGANINHVSKTCAVRWDDYFFDLCSVVHDMKTHSKLQSCGSTLLHAAAVHGHAKIMSYLLDNNVNLQAKFGSYLTALDLAAEFGHLVVVRMLHKAGLIPTRVAFRFAVLNDHIAVVDYLLTSGFRESCENCDEILNYRHYYEQEPSFTCLVSLCHDITFCETALQTAIRMNNFNMVKQLASIESTTLNCPDVAGLLPIHHAVINRDWELFYFILGNGADRDAMCHPVSRVAEKLLVNKSNLTSPVICSCSMNALHFSAMLGFADIAYELVVEHNANVMERDCNGATPIHIAACHNKLEVFETLLRLNVDPNERSINGSTPLHSAALCGATSMFLTMRKHGCNILARDDKNMTAAHYFVKYRTNTLPFIRLDHHDVHENLAQFEEWLDTLIHLGYSKETYSSILSTDNNGRTVLHLLALNGEAVGLKALLYIANYENLNIVKVRDKFGQTALDVALAKIEYLCRHENSKPLAMSRVKGLSGSYDLVIHRLLDLGGQFELLEQQGNCSSYLSRIISIGLQYTMMFCLQKIANNRCENTSREKLLLHYLESKESMMTMVRLKHYNMSSFPPLCTSPYNKSVLHLLASRTTDFSLLLYNISGLRWSSYYELRPISDFELYHPVFLSYDSLERNGLLLDIISSAKGELDKCLDKDGYSVLHRAAQASNIPALELFLSLGTNVFALTPEKHSVFSLVILHAINLRKKFDTRQAVKHNTLSAAIGNRELDIRLATKAVTALLRHAVKRGFSEHCNGGLTLYHYAASRGMDDLIYSLFDEFNFYEANFVCKDKYHVTPLYLAQLYASILENSEVSVKSEYSTLLLPNQRLHRVASYIEWNSGIMRNNFIKPRRSAELYLIYNYLYRHVELPFALDLSEEILRGLARNTKMKSCRYFNPDQQEMGIHSSSPNVFVDCTTVNTEILLLTQNFSIHCNTSVHKTQAEFEQKHRAFMELYVKYSIEEHNSYRSYYEEDLSQILRKAYHIKAELADKFVSYLSTLKMFLYKNIYNFVHKNFKSIKKISSLVEKINNIVGCRYVYAYGRYVVTAFKTFGQDQTRKGRVPFPTSFIKNRMDWEWHNHHQWPLRFLVKIALNETVNLAYLKTLNTGI